MSISKLIFEKLEAAVRGERINYEDIEIERAGIVGYAARARQWAADRDAGDRAEHRRKMAIQLRDQATGRFPSRAVDAALATWPDETTAMRSARQFARGRKQAIVFAGGCGAGKTSAATWLALEMGGSSPGFIRTSALEKAGRYSKDTTSWIGGLSALVIDDLGTEVLDGKGVFRSLLDEIIDDFYGSKRLLIMTTNLVTRRDRADDEAQFVERYGERITSRLAEIGTWAGCGNRDLRRDQLKLGAVK